MQNVPVRFDVENMIKAQAGLNVFGDSVNISISQGNVSLVNLPAPECTIMGTQQPELFPCYSYLLKSGLLNLYSNTIEGSFSPSPPKNEEQSKNTLSLKIRRAISNCLCMENASSLSIRGSLTISAEDQKPLTVAFTDGTVHLAAKAGVITTPSKRKAYHPVKYTGSIPSSNSSCSSITNPTHLSGCTTPNNSEFCALDLSKGVSSVPSTQVTPLKEDQTLKAQSYPFELLSLSQQSGLLNLYQKQRNMIPPSRDTTPGPKQRRRLASTSIQKSNSTRQFACNQCAIVFGSLQALEEHTTSIHGSYRCHICNATFTQRSNLQRHALKHVGFKPFECCLCERAYFRKDHLMRHMETTHPGVPARANIRVRLTSSESLDYLSRVVGPAHITEEAEHEDNGNTKAMREQESIVDEIHSMGTENPLQQHSTDSIPIGQEEPILLTNTRFPDAHF